MRKVLRIIVSSLLSLMIVYMGVGVVMVYCLHDGEAMSAAHVEQVAHDKKDCHEPMSSCMKVMVSKLSPTSMAQALHFDFHAFQPIMFVNDCSQLVPKPVFHLVNQQLVEINPNGPPRAWLNKISVLII